MRRMWIVARHEFLTQVRQRGFLMMVFLFPLLIGGLGVLSGSIGARQASQSDTLGAIGVVDLSGVLAAEHAKPEDYITFASPQEAAEALEAGQIGGYFVVAADYMTSGVVNGYAYGTMGLGVQEAFETYLKDNLLAGVDEQRATLARDPAQIALATMDERLNLPEETGIYMLMVPIFFAVILVLSITMTSSTMMQTVVAEKETRMVEVLATTIGPLPLLAGKILALFGLGLLQILVWSVMLVVVLRFRPDVSELMQGVQFPGWLLAVAGLYLFLGYLLYGTLLAGIGASSRSMQEAQPLAGLFSFAGVTPLFFMVQFLGNPNGILPTILSMVPFTAPTAMLVRLVLGTVPLWQVVLSLLLMTLTTGVMLWLAAWIFRVGLLMTGNRLRWGTLMRAIRQDKQNLVGTEAI